MTSISGLEWGMGTGQETQDGAGKGLGLLRALPTWPFSVRRASLWHLPPGKAACHLPVNLQLRSL